MPVHLYGLMADMDPLVRIAERHGLTIIEDAAQAHGAPYRGRRAGQFGPAMFSLYATKNLMTGEGGFATTDDDELADRIRLYRNHGMRVRYHHESLGTNFKPTDLAAAIGLAQLAQPRRAHRAAPAERRAPVDGPRAATSTPDASPTGREHVWHQYTMRFPGERQRGHRRARRARRSGRSSTTRCPSTARRTSRRSSRARPTSTCRSRTGSPTRSCRSPSARA